VRVPSRARPLAAPAALAAALAALASLSAPAPVRATAPHYCSFDREQRLDHDADPDDLLRVWVAYVGQGDGVLVELPPRLTYQPEGGGPAERLEVLIDAGAFRDSDRVRMNDFLHQLPPDGVPVLEHVVISHHDKDHVLGITHLLRQPDVAIETLYHNGLASYLAGKGEFVADVRPASDAAVLDWDGGRLKRGMAFLETDGSGDLQAEYLVDARDSLESDHAARLYQGIYLDLVEALLEKDRPRPVAEVSRLAAGAPFVTERERARVPGIAGPEGVRFELLWPPDPPRRFGDWGETINGNSVTFRLRYRDFEMLFTGDHNERSEEAMLWTLEAEGRLGELACDVLKVPHHGSSHGIERFFREAAKPVVAVVSVGRKGFRSKATGSNAWQHPSTDIIRWLGGAHRVYRTLIHERHFDWEDLDTEAELEEMVETSVVDGRVVEGMHVLVETDGTWFRVVEVPPGSDLADLPTPREVRRGDGTRWVRAAPTPGGAGCSTP